MAFVNPTVKPHRRCFTGSPPNLCARGKRSKWVKLEAETAGMVQKLSVSLDIENSNSNVEKTNRIVTSQETHRIVRKWSQIASSDSRNKQAASKCLQVVEFLEDNCKGTSLEPNRHFYDLVLQALCATRQVQMAHDILLKNRETAVETSSQRRTAKVSAKSFHIVMNAWVKKQSDCLQQVQTLYENLESLYQETEKRNKELRPNERTLTVLLSAWAQSGRKDAKDNILELLDEASNSGQELDMVLFHTLLHLLVKNSARARRHNDGLTRRQTARFCEQLLQMAKSTFDLNPTAQTYSLVINAWAQCEALERKGQAAERAQDLLLFMMDSYATGGANVKPNTHTITTCMAAWARCNQPQKAEALLEELLSQYQQTQDPDLKPDTACGNAVVLAWSRSDASNAVDKTKEALTNLQSFAHADLISYNALLHAYAHNGMHEEAQALLEDLEGSKVEAGKSVLLPDVVSYNCVLHALVRSHIEVSREYSEPDIGLKAQEIVDKMKSLSKDRPSVAPTSATYTLLLQAYAKQLNSPRISHETAERAPLKAIHQILLDTLALSSSARSQQHERQNSNAIAADAMFFAALFHACSTKHLIQFQRDDAWALAAEVMVGVLTTISRGEDNVQFPLATGIEASLSVPHIPSFRIADDRLFAVMLETCNRFVGSGQDDLGRAAIVDESNGATESNSTRPAKRRVIVGTNTNYAKSTTLHVEAMAENLIKAIVNRVQKDGLLSRRVLVHLQTLSETVGKHNSSRQERTIHEWLFEEASGNDDDLTSRSSSHQYNEKHMRRALPRDWSRRIPSKHRP